MPDPIPAENSDQSAYDLESRVAMLEKIFKNHLGPNFAASSMNIPHPQLATLQAAIDRLSLSNGRYM